jgi:hypothetical protein
LAISQTLPYAHHLSPFIFKTIFSASREAEMIIQGVAKTKKLKIHLRALGIRPSDGFYTTSLISL